MIYAFAPYTYIYTKNHLGGGGAWPPLAPLESAPVYVYVCAHVCVLVVISCI